MIDVSVPAEGRRLRELLDRLVEERGVKPGHYAYFFTTGEGRELPGSRPDAVLEETSGFVIDRGGRIFSFWLEWDPDSRRPVLSEWEQVPPEPHWRDEPEYRRAREQVGLPLPSPTQSGS